MKALAGLLVEYLVIGAVSFIWLFPLTIKSPAFLDLIDSKEVCASVVALALPVIYVVGMICDYWGYTISKLGILGKYGKTGIEKKIWGENNDPHSQKIHVYATSYEPKLAEEIEARSSRDRVARGAFVAFLPVVFWPPTTLPYFLHYILSIAVLTSLALLWYRYQTLSAKYEKKVRDFLEKRYNLQIDDDTQRIRIDRASETNHDLIR
jgi:hypothetical protein